MNELLKINADGMTVSARDLHKELKINSNFTTWFNRMVEYGFSEGEDFFPKMEESTGGRPSIDYEITIDMAKEICMIQRTPEGKRCREYLIQLEKAWNTPELVMARGLQAAQKMIEQKDEKIKLLTADNERMKPKEIFADAVTASDSAILVRDLAKILKQNGISMGEKRLYKWMRENGYIIKGLTSPTQRAMELGLFEIVERTVQRADLPPMVSQTTKVTGKGQSYFLNKFLGERKQKE